VEGFFFDRIWHNKSEVPSDLFEIEMPGRKDFLE